MTIFNIATHPIKERQFIPSLDLIFQRGYCYSIVLKYDFWLDSTDSNSQVFQLPNAWALSGQILAAGVRGKMKNFVQLMPNTTQNSENSWMTRSRFSPGLFK